MHGNNSRLIRLLEILEILQLRTGCNSDTFAEILGVSRRTIFRDIKLLRDAGIPVIFDSELQQYRTPQRKVIWQEELTFEEAFCLFVLCSQLGSCDQGIPYLSHAHSASIKVLRTLPNRLQGRVTEAARNISINLASENESVGRKWEVFQTILRGNRERRCVRIDYQESEESKHQSTLLSPYAVTYLNKSWYAVGRSSYHRKLQDFNITTINSAEILQTQFRTPQRFQSSRYFEQEYRRKRSSESETETRSSNS